MANKRSAETNYNTNLSEFLMMSLLSRTGKDPYLSLGNKKGVDIIITSSKGIFALLEVKGVNKKSDDWLVGSKGVFESQPNLFYALVSFKSEIRDINVPAQFWILPSSVIADDNYKVSKDGKTVYISHKLIRTKFGEAANTFKLLDEYLENN